VSGCFTRGGDRLAERGHRGSVPSDRDVGHVPRNPPRRRRSSGSGRQRRRAPPCTRRGRWRGAWSTVINPDSIGWQPEGRLDNRAGQTHSADRRPVEIALRCGADVEPSACGDERELFDVGAERTVSMVVLTVHVRRNRAADGDVARAGRDRNEPSGWNDEREQCVK